MQRSPLRYPGGKSRAVHILLNILQEYFPSQKTVISPFIGGGSFEIFLINHDYNVYANDLFEPVYAFWLSVLFYPIRLKNEIRLLHHIDKEIFYSLRKKIKTEQNIVKQAAIFFAINRCSFNGSTFSGGFSNEAAIKRFNEASIQRVKPINGRVRFYNLDYEEFLQLNTTSNSVIFLDPPYYIDSHLYGHNGDLHEDFDHLRLHRVLSKYNNWILCYNDCIIIRELYKKYKIISASWSYGMNRSKKSSEIIIINNK